MSDPRDKQPDQLGDRSNLLRESRIDDDDVDPRDGGRPVNANVDFLHMKGDLGHIIRKEQED